MLRCPIKIKRERALCSDYYESFVDTTSWHCRESVVLNAHGDEVVSVQLQKFDISHPVTPQSGLDCHISDLPFMLRTRIKIAHEPAYLSLSKQSDPYTSGRVGRELAALADKTFSNLKSISDNKKKSSVKLN